MPTYEYRCKDCGHELEIVQSFIEDALTVCPSCGGNLRKVFGAVGITFKGSGFYKTDSRSSGSKTSPGSDTSTGTSTSSGSGESSSTASGSSTGSTGTGSTSSTSSTSTPA